MLARIIKPLPNAIVEQAKANGVTSLANLLQVPPDAVVWTEDTMGPVVDFLADIEEGEKSDAEIVAEIETKHGACKCIAIEKNKKMKWAKKPKAGWVMKHEFAGLEVTP